MRKSTTVALLGVSLAASSATAQTSPTIDVSYEHIHSRTLDNGLDVIVIENDAVPIVTIEVAVRNGAFTEDEEINGLSHLYEHMFFKANEVYPSQEAYMARQRELGMVWNGTTGTERVNYYFTLHRDRLREGLEFMDAAIRTPRFDEAELARERQVVLGEYDRNESNPFYFLSKAIDELLWFEHGSRKDPLGDREAILDATVDEMRAMQAAYYVPNNTLLVLSGDVTADEGFALADEIFGDWARGSDPFQSHPVPEHPPMPGDVAAVVEQPVGVSAIAFAWHGPDTRGDIDATYAADVFSFILSQASSEFQRALVDSGIALEASLSYSTQRYTGPITLFAVTFPGREAEAIEAINRELERFDDPDYFTDAQLEAAATLLAISDLYTQQSTDEMAHTISYWWASASPEYYLSYIERLREVTRDDIVDYVETYILGRPRATVLLTSSENATEHDWTSERLLELAKGESE